MDLLSKVGCYFRWTRCPKDPPRSQTTAAAASTITTTTTTNTTTNTTTEYHPEPVVSSSGDSPIVPSAADLDNASRICDVVESILLWENSVNSISVVVVFNLLFWGIVVLEVRGFAAASSAALVVVLCYSTLESQIEKGNDKGSRTSVSHAKAEQIDKIRRRVKSALEQLKELRRDQPGVFCTAICSISLGLWIVGRAISGVLLAYTMCMAILLGPGMFLKLPEKMMSHKEWDSEIEEFLPAVTEDNLQVLRRAGESGDQSPTPTSMTSEAQNEFFDEELIGLKMPSHDDGSTDGVELSELELSTGDADVDGIKFRSGHFEKGSSSEEEAELQPEARKLLIHSHESDDDSDCEFEIIDSQEVADLSDEA